jgi:hypothetical protein
MSAERNNPFDLGDLVPQALAQTPKRQIPEVKSADLPASPPLERPTDRPSRAQIDQLAKDTGFVSRERPRMGPRRRTGRNRQLNLKIREQDLERFYQYADRKNYTLGEAFEKAMDALETLDR